MIEEVLFPVEILVSLPQEWQLVARLKQGEMQLYVAGFPSSQERGHGNKFSDLSAEINLFWTVFIFW